MMAQKTWTQWPECNALDEQILPWMERLVNLRATRPIVLAGAIFYSDLGNYTNYEEYQNGTHPILNDTDGDLWLDEVGISTRPGR